MLMGMMFLRVLCLLKVSRGLDLVYGGGSIGLMGLVSKAVHLGGGHVLGIIPRTLMSKEVGLLNVDGYYNSLLTFIDKAVDDGFIKPSQRHIFVSAPNPKELVQKLEEYVPVHDETIANLDWGRPLLIKQRSPVMEKGKLVNKSRFKTVCVFCGSSTGKRTCYRDAAVELGQELHVDRYDVSSCVVLLKVSRGLDLVYGGGSIGLMGLVSKAVHLGGGHVLGIIPRTLMSKEVGLLNVDGYYNSLLTFIDKAVDDGFIKPSQRHIFVSSPNPKELVQKLEEYVPVHDETIANLDWGGVVVQEVPKSTVGFSGLQTTEISL
ncbi:hypothetical protein RHGRI_013311 [Rhododendron griersonianum]|uniref:cytokinin riboside 5'-monophosphate phosphoribohydrolase n=1 Tax=Rhododendron griersonianum TaxID=479676 RepID=A0AAV6K570_9ERIC|nr:hypothetical protein RHGRI_013311 [Rhododendron griersonianum]